MPWSVPLATCPGAAGREVFSTWVASVLYLKGGCYSRTTGKGSGGQGFRTSLQKAAGPPNGLRAGPLSVTICPPPVSDKTPQNCPRRASARLATGHVTVSHLGQGSRDISLEAVGGGALVREQEGGRPAGGGSGGEGAGREREASTAAWGQLIPSHLGPPSHLRFACAADFLPRRGRVPLLHPLPPPRRKKAPCPLYQLGLAPGEMGVGLAELGQGHLSPLLLGFLSLPPTQYPHLV